ncbi:anaerobic C4-dicarboxylate transporter [Tepidibacillus marianensis]|uniref:anaerobic C4-dicarboxylate transporter n=1 Tax=Tepidibacillus marianensis TaxID=3131995 RepID=UPI0030CBEE6D
MIWLEFFVVLLAIIIGAKLGGVGLGVMGGVGLAVLTFVFHLQPTSPPIDVMLMIVAVVTAAGALQAAGGLDYLVSLAEKMLRKNPQRITFFGPIVTYLFTLFAGTGHVAYSVLPVIAEVSRETGVRPERPMSISVIASQQAITASPISAATVALLGLTASSHIQLIDILKVSIPATFIGVIIAAFFASKMGKDLDKDPEYLARLNAGMIPTKKTSTIHAEVPKTAKISVVLFLIGALLVVLFGTFPALRPSWQIDGQSTQLGMPIAIEIVMLTIAALIVLINKVNVEEITKGNVFLAGIQAVIAIFGIAWMGDTFFQGNMDTLSGSIKELVTTAPWLFAVALFILSIFLYSQAATVRALMPLGISLGIPAAFLIAMFPAVNGYFFIPNYGTVVAAINFDTTKTTRIGKYILNHSFMIPGLIATISSVAIGFLLVQLMF